MHETGIVRALVRKLEAAAEVAGAQRVVSVEVWLGALTQFSPAHFREHFDEEVRGTRAAGAALRIVASHDMHDPRAQSVIMQGVEFDVADEEGGAP
ncbi:hydrogenase maturation nickel metallochaperone HypA [Ralstonia chuxiongensis]|uniref:hydrogenase maturation nickel metallochaperone HypA n=1 Tax=Ralstonia chuxiongensis TaxID=2957504 RepID=UPI0028F5BD70|nr:hydrogenase maturation nickel metallochaperone HypA [Ralstonia chuxiongensis]CAJ0780189.1 Hydrogenase maturation factor HypA [Ralstonia chuxiongensis]